MFDKFKFLNLGKSASYGTQVPVNCKCNCKSFAQCFAKKIDVLSLSDRWNTIPANKAREIALQLYLQFYILKKHYKL